MKKSILFPAAAVLAAAILMSRHSAEARPDVVSAASLVVAIVNITPTTAVASYSKDKYDYGTRTLCYDPAPAVASHNCTTRTASGNQGTMNFLNLTPHTQYNFSIMAVDTKGKEKPYTTSGSFTTTGTTSISPKPAGLGGSGMPTAIRKFDLTGRDIAGAGAQVLKVTRPAR